MEQIEIFLKEADILSYIIEKSNFMIARLEGNDELQQEYTEQLKPTLDEYKSTIQALKFLFEEYFDWEKRTISVRNLRYRRLYTQLCKQEVKV